MKHHNQNTKNQTPKTRITYICYPKKWKEPLLGGAPLQTNNKHTSNFFDQKKLLIPIVTTICSLHIPPLVFILKQTNLTSYKTHNHIKIQNLHTKLIYFYIFSFENLHTLTNIFSSKNATKMISTYIHTFLNSLFSF